MRPQQQTPHPMDIRKLTPQDAADYRALRTRALWEHPEAFTSSYEEHEKQPIEVSEKRLASELTILWGAFDADQLCGMVGLELETRVKTRHKGKVVAMYVASESAGAGIGRALLDTLVNEARAMGLELLVLTVTEGNDTATSLYEKAGFRSFGIEPGAIKVDGRIFGKNHMYLELKSS
jgi:ribosomal protein S18 acetylase RimI-like enzyme